MDCKHIKDNLCEYIDGELSKDKSDEIIAHLATCTECNEEYSRLIELSASLNELPMKKMPEDVEERLMSRLELDAPNKRPLVAKLATSPFIAVAAVIVIVVYASLFTSKAPEIQSLTDESRIEKSLSPPAEIGANSAGRENRSSLILADISDSSNEDGISMEAPSVGSGMKESIPDKNIESFDDNKISLPSIVVTSSKDYIRDELPKLLNVNTPSLTSGIKLMESNEKSDASLKDALGEVSVRYTSGIPIYAERATFVGEEAWFIVISDGNLRRLLVVKTDG